MHPRRPKLVSFSGIDGAGKTTQIDALLQHLTDSGYQWQLRTFWDDVVAFSRWRERVSLQVFKGDAGVGSLDRPIVRRDKNVTSFHVVLLRLVLYVCDAIRLRLIVSRCMNNVVDFVIFDRYIYDELANLPIHHWALRIYARAVLWFAPRPDVAFLLDADPEKAQQRKPEYPLEFVRRNRETYVALAQIAGMTVAPPSSIPETTQRIREIVFTKSRDAGVSTGIDLTPSAAMGSVKTRST
ncbi:MAG TPA: hypothetical protein VMU05_04485 [Dongiaceae bacterium]|nr:hypothetical protein [Dongiaceae bacterium]